VNGYAEQTPSGGVHVFCRLADGAVPGNTKLACRPATDDELAANPADKIKVLIETRGEGGFAVVAPSNGRTHPTGLPWVQLRGGPGSVATITMAEHEQLWEVARSFDAMPVRAPSSPVAASGGQPVQLGSGAAYASWESILTPHGWVYAGDDAKGDQQWSRPGKDSGTSATTHRNGGLYVFSSSTEFGTGIAYSKPAVSAVLNDGLDASAALARYGDPAAARNAAEFAQLAADLAWVGMTADDLIARRPTAAGAPAPAWRWAGPLPRFGIANRAVAAEQLRTELGRGPLAGLYLRDGVIVHTPRIGEDGYVPPGADEKARGVGHGPAQVRPASPAHVKALVEVRYDVGKSVKVKDPEPGEPEQVWVKGLFPPDAAQHAVSAAELGVGCPNLAHLTGVTHTPVMRPDGTILAAPGYDQATGLLYLPLAGLIVPPVPDHPSAAEVAAAVSLLRTPVAKFPWVAPHHEANWLGAMFTPLLRLLLPPPYQMVIITATNAGSGKTYLMRMLGIVHGIVTRGEFPREREELRKLFVSTLLTTTAPIIGMDNVRGTIYSSELEALLTMRTLTDRQLGASRTVTVDNDRLWVATGNNAKIAGDLARRVLPVAIDPGCASPHKRVFSFSPVDWMTAHRGDYLAALLTVARGWVQAGAPVQAAGRSDDYGSWYGSLRGLLSWAGVPGAFGAEDRRDLSAVSEDDGQWSVFVAALSKTFGSQSFTARDVVTRLSAEIQPYGSTGVQPLTEALPGELTDKWERLYGGKMGGFTKSLGHWVAIRDGRFTPEGLAVRSEDPGAKHALRYVVVGAGAVS
jgi:hypothetical protein